MPSDLIFVGTMTDARGRAIAFGTDGDEVRITVTAASITLAPQQQDEFARLYQAAGRQAEKEKTSE